MKPRHIKETRAELHRLHRNHLDPTIEPPGWDLCERFLCAAQEDEDFALLYDAILLLGAFRLFTGRWPQDVVPLAFAVRYALTCSPRKLGTYLAWIRDFVETMPDDTVERAFAAYRARKAAPRD